MAGVTKVCALRSGSSGNSLFVTSGSTRLLIDAGVPGRDIERALAAIDEDAHQLDGILVTHEHTDHMSGIGVLMRRYHLPLYVNQATWQAMRPNIGKINETLVHIHPTGSTFEVGDLSVQSFATSHDAADPVAYRLETDRGAVAVFTDTGWPDPRLLESLAGSRLVFVEANYDPAMLAAGHYPQYLKQRIAGQLGHLSNQDSAQAVTALLSTGSTHFVLSHLSKENNYPELAYMTVRNHLLDRGAQIGRDLQMAIARRYDVSDPICLG